MPFAIVRNDIVNMQVDAIVNSANPEPVIGYGVDSGIHREAGPELLEARRRIGKIPAGSASVTPAYGLDARYVIHTVCPAWQGGGHGEVELLRRCYLTSMELALRRRCGSIAFPLLASGNNGFPNPLALQTAISAIGEFLMEQELQVYLVVFNRDAWQLSEKLFRGISSFIDENYVQEKSFFQYGLENRVVLEEDHEPEVLKAQLQRRREEMLRQARRQQEEEWFDLSADDSDAPSAVFDGEEAREITGRDLPRQPEPCSRSIIYDGAPAPRRKPGAALPQYTVAEMEITPGAAAPNQSLEDYLTRMDAGFSETLLRLIDRSGKKDSEIYARANVSRQHFSKIRNKPDYRPTKATAIAFAIALELNLEQTKDLIGRAGYTLTNSSKFDLIIMYFIQQRNYDLFEINAALFRFDQSLLGA